MRRRFGFLRLVAARAARGAASEGIVWCGWRCGCGACGLWYNVRSAGLVPACAVGVLVGAGGERCWCVVEVDVRVWVADLVVVFGFAVLCSLCSLQHSTSDLFF